MTSREWLNYFSENLKRRRVNWQHPAKLDRIRDRQIVRSLQAWQRGETSDGRHLLRAAGKYAVRRNDPEYLQAISLFIQEEQKHGENLGRYLDSIGADRISFDLGDWLFRRVRYFNSNIEIWTVSVIIVETFAQFYYAALSRAANCLLLSDICKDILTDEAQHIRFQAERLNSIVEYRGNPMRLLSTTLYRVLLFTAAVSVWLGHAYVFRQGGISFRRFWRMADRRFKRIVAGFDAQEVSRINEVEQAGDRKPDHVPS